MGKTTYPPVEIGSGVIAGDIQILGDLTVQGTTSQVQDILTTQVKVTDSNNNNQITINGDASTPNITLTNAGSYVQYGTTNPMTTRFDSSSGSIRWRDTTNTADRMSLARTSGNLEITGNITEGASL